MGRVVSQFRQPFQQLGAARLGETELDDRAVDSDQTIGGHLRQPGDDLSIDLIVTGAQLAQGPLGVARVAGQQQDPQPLGGARRRVGW
jgi:hypothetical protein